MNVHRNNRWLTALAVAGVAVMAAAFTTPAARAQTFTTPDGATDTAGEPVSASATFVVTANTITITLTNLQADPNSVGQNISDLFFSTAVAGDLTGSTLSSASGQQLTVKSGGGFTLDGTVDLNGPWAYNGSGHLDDLTNQFPNYTIIGPPGSDPTTAYSGASFTADHHNPYVNQTATFTITGSNITAGTTITDVVFSFGTESGDNVAAVPEPSTMAIAGLGTLGFMGYGLRRRLKK
jgi:hypothetical protein